MFTDTIKKDFITQVIDRDIQNIYKAQLLIATKNIYMRGRTRELHKRKGPTIQGTGRLAASLKNPDYKISVGDSSITVTNTISKQLRFLDMKAHGDWRIYNRQIWGILYNNALQDIEAGVGDQIHDHFGKMLRDIFLSRTLI
jgi:hypothetical protein